MIGTIKDGKSYEWNHNTVHKLEIKRKILTDLKNQQFKYLTVVGSEIPKHGFNIKLS